SLTPPPPPRLPLFPYTTLFRSQRSACPPELRPPARHRRPQRVSRGRRRVECPHGFCAREFGPLRPCLCATRRRQCRYGFRRGPRSEEHTSELQSRFDLVCRLLL